jgi:hypothetical protein
LWHVFMCLVLCCSVCYGCYVNNIFGLSWLPFVLFGVHGLFMLIVLIYVYMCPTRFQYHMMCRLLNSNTTGAISAAGTANSSGEHEFTPGFFISAAGTANSSRTWVHTWLNSSGEHEFTPGLIRQDNMSSHWA